MKKKKTVMAFGAFDLLHAGHMHFLRQASRYGGYLVVVVARDKTVEELKGNAPTRNENERLEKVSRLGFVDKAILGDKENNKYDVIRRARPDIICLGYDQRSFTAGLEKWLDSMGLDIEIVRLEPYKAHKYKTSIIKQKGGKGE